MKCEYPGCENDAVYSDRTGRWCPRHEDLPDRLREDERKRKSPAASKDALEAMFDEAMGEYRAGRTVPVGLI
jgi:hypothetical protein